MSNQETRDHRQARRTRKCHTGNGFSRLGGQHNKGGPRDPDPRWRWEDDYDGDPVDNEPAAEEELDFEEEDMSDLDMFDNEALEWGGVDYG